MDRFTELRTFIAVTKAAGFAAAARELGTSRSSVNRLVIGLEERLGVQLLNRTTRRVAPTATGRALLERAAQILDDLDEMEREISASTIEPIGAMRVNAPMSFGTIHLGKAVADFMIRHPRVLIELVLSDRFVDPIVVGYDVTIRIAKPEEETTLVDHRIVEARRVLCAAPAYLAKNGIPTHPSELAQHACLHSTNLASGNFWKFSGPDGPVGVHANIILSANNAEPLRDAAVAGLGIALVPTFIGGEEIKSGQLVPVLSDYTAPPIILQALYPPARHLSAKVRLFVEFLIGRFGEPPHWDSSGPSDVSDLDRHQNL
ncbi:MAG: LysR substrate-binding domain-containing protein [Pseudomonadota bacterium]